MYSCDELVENMGIPKWMVFFVENPIYKWMKTGGTPILQGLGLMSRYDGEFPYETMVSFRECLV